MYRRTFWAICRSPWAKTRNEIIRVGVLQFFIAARFVNLAVSLPQYQFASHTSTGTITAFDGTPLLVSYVSAGGTGASISIPNNLQGQSPVVSIAASCPRGQDAACGVGRSSAQMALEAVEMPITDFFVKPPSFISHCS